MKTIIKSIYQLQGKGKKIMKSRNSSKQSNIKLQKRISTDDQSSVILISNPPLIQAQPNSQKSSNKEHLIVLTIFCTIIILMGSFLTYSIYINLQRANQKLQKIELKFHKFLFYLKYIYKTQKQKEQIDAEQTSSIVDLFTKLTTNDQHLGQAQKKDPTALKNQDVKVKKSISRKNSHSVKSTSSDDQDDQLFSHDQMIDIAKKIIEEESSLSENNNSTTVNQQHQADNYKHHHKQQHPELPHKQPQLYANRQSTTNQFNCHIDQQNQFYINFHYDPSSQRLRKSVFTSSFQTIVCQQPVPRQGITQMSIKILQTEKSFIYFGIAGGSDSQIYNKTSIHQNSNFYGYSGFSGRIWEGKKRKTGYEMLQRNTVLKLRVDMGQGKMEYSYNDIKIGESALGELCVEQCKFVVEMYNQGDEVEFLHPQEIHEQNATGIETDIHLGDL